MSEDMGDSVAAGDDASASSVDTASQDTGGSLESQSSESSVQQSTPAAPQPSVWDSFRAVPDFQGQDDAAIARNLYAAFEREKQSRRVLAQYQQYVPALREYAANKSAFDQWRASQQQQPVAQPEKKGWWNPPEVKDSWKQYITKDENGRDVISPEAPIDVRHALVERQKYIADFARKFLDNPEEAIGPMVQEIAQKQAAEIVQRQFQEQSEQQFVSSVEQENAAWLFEDGDPSRPTPEGIAARQFVDEAVSMGIRDPNARWQYAQMKVEHMLQKRVLEMMQQRGQQPSAPVQQFAPPPAALPDAPSAAQEDMNYLRRAASRNPSRGAPTGESRPAAPQTFESMLAQQMGRL